MEGYTIMYNNSLYQSRRSKEHLIVFSSLSPFFVTQFGDWPDIGCDKIQGL